MLAFLLTALTLAVATFASAAPATDSPPMGASGGPTYAASVPVSNAFDGNQATYWQGSYNTDLSGTGTPYTATAWDLTYGYVSAKNVTGVTVDYVDSRFVVPDATVTCSTDGSVWAPVATLPATVHAAVAFAAVCRWVRLQMGRPSASASPGVYEVNITTAGDAVGVPPAGHPSFPAPTSIAAIGDSISAGSYAPYPYTTLLPIWTDAKVANKAISGATTETMLAQQIGPALDTGAQVVLIMGGSNDCDFGWPTTRSMAAIASLVQRAWDAGREPVLVGPIPRTAPTQAGPSFPVCLTALRDAERDYARAHSVRFIDPWTAFEGAPGSGLPNMSLLADTAHPNARGAFVLARTVAHALNLSFPGD